VPREMESRLEHPVLDDADAAAVAAE
jgi:hypothetical protein